MNITDTPCRYTQYVYDQRIYHKFVGFFSQIVLGLFRKQHHKATIKMTKPLLDVEFWSHGYQSGA